MKKYPLLVLLFIGALVLAACGRGQTPAATLTPAATTSPTSTYLPTAEPTAAVTQAPVNTRTQYDLTAVLNYPSHQVTVDEIVNYTNRSSGVFQELVFVVEPNLLYGVFDLNSLKWQDGTDVTGAVLLRQKLTVPLTEPLQPGRSVELHLNYTLNLPDEEGVLCFTTTQVNLAGWYPYAAPYIEGQGWVVHDPGSVGEYQVYELADFKVAMRVDDAPTGFITAASAMPSVDQGWTHYEQTDARNFTWSGSFNYNLLEDNAGDIHVQAYVFGYDLESGKASLAATVQALELYSSLYGPYPHKSLTIVEIAYPDGIEYDGLYFLGKEYFNDYQGQPNSYLTTISVHETAHQWWYGMVANDQAENPWLDETFAAYSELLYYQNDYPDLASWWWETRVNYFVPKGWVNSTIYNFTYERSYVDAVYLHGVQFLQAVRDQVGDDVFMKFLRGYFTTLHERANTDHQGFATPDDFWKVLGKYSNADFSAIKKEYFSQP